MTVAVLYAHRRSVYKTLPGVDVWDEDRDARLWPGGAPAVAHPPCRAWARLSALAKPKPHEKQLAIDAVAAVRRWGGVVEHPAYSKLWAHLGLPIGHATDEFGGFTVLIDQVLWGHPCRKPTYLYVAGLERRDVPPIPAGFVNPTHVIDTTRRQDNASRLPPLPKSQRERTPEPFARWLIELASRCRPQEERPC